MTVAELRQIVILLANSCYVRYWVHYNYPNQSPWLMAISVQSDNVEQLAKELGEKGFHKVSGEQFHLWTVERIDDEGRPFTSEIFS